MHQGKDDNHMISYAASMKMPGRGRLGAAMTSILFASAFTLLAAVLPSAGIHAQEDSKPNINPAPTVAVDETDLAPLTTRSHGISLYGDLKYGPDFHHFDYVNPDAPKGGKLLQSSIVAFDTLNPFTLKGNAAAGIGLVYDSLMVSSADEPSSMYGLIAREIELPQDRSFAIFHLDPRAKFQDGSDITAEDVKFSYEILLEKGSPVYRQVFYRSKGPKSLTNSPSNSLSNRGTIAKRR